MTNSSPDGCKGDASVHHCACMPVEEEEGEEAFVKGKGGVHAKVTHGLPLSSSHSFEGAN